MIQTFSSKGSVGRGGFVKWPLIFAVTALAIFAVSGWAWWHFVRSNPERTLLSAIENNLRTEGYVKGITQGQNGQTLRQNVRLRTGAQQAAQGKTEIEQGQTRVATESVSTDRDDYVRYIDIKTNQRSRRNRPLDFKPVLNTWGRSSAQQAGGATGELYGETVLGAIPAGNLNVHDRKAIMQMVKDRNIYRFDEKGLRRQIRGGRPYYTYALTIPAEPYVTMLKAFGKASGLKQLDQVNPASYRSAEPLRFQLEVDVWSQQISGISFQDGQRTERYSGYGIVQAIDIPSRTIPTMQLQAKLQSIQ